MQVRDAVTVVHDRYPFPGYMDLSRHSVYESICSTVQRHLPAGSKVLDFGAGACDRTAVLQVLGYACSACDDLQDAWHLEGDNASKIRTFSSAIGIDFRQVSSPPLPYDDGTFDMVMATDVIEHLHESPRELLNDLVVLLKPGGLLLVTVPNAVNIRKRVDVLRGRTNLPPFPGYYWYPGSWRGHVREYVKNDLEQLVGFLRLETVELRGADHMLFKLPRAARPAYRLATSVFPGWGDSWLLLARKPPDWEPRRALPEDELARVVGRSCTD